MPMPLPPAQLEQLKQMVEAGPPPAPTSDKPGLLMQEMSAFAGKVRTETGADPSLKDLFMHLLYVLDMRQWHEATAAWNQMKKMYDAHQRPLITTPNFMPPKDLISKP